MNIIIVIILLCYIIMTTTTTTNTTITTNLGIVLNVARMWMVCNTIRKMQ